jgi:hypothetical protein
MYKDMIAIPHVDKSHTSMFSYTSYTHISLSCFLTYLVKVINTLKQDAWVSNYKHINPFWFHILRTIWLQQGDCRFRYPVNFLLSLPLSEVDALRTSVMKDEIFGVSYVWTRILTSDDCETEILDSDRDLTTNPPHKQSRYCPLVFTSHREVSIINGRK